jgi:hypothetical protein
MICRVSTFRWRVGFSLSHRLNEDRSLILPHDLGLMRNRKRMRHQNEIVGMPKAVSRNHIKKKRVFENLVAVSKNFCLTSAHVCGGELT